MIHALLFVLWTSSTLAAHYHVAVKGGFTCNNSVYEHAHVELFDYDIFYPDVKLSESESGKNGKFYVEGDRVAWVPMVPYFTVTEKCRGVMSCWKYWIPADYQWTDGNPKKIYHVNKINLTDPHQETC